MKSYQASQELVNILLKNGFIEVTERYYPHHSVRFKGDNYDPHGMKRMFSMGSYKDYILFDYINIRLPNGEGRYDLTEDELKSIIIFHNLSSADRRAWKDSGYGIFDVGKRLTDLKRHPAIYNTALNRRISTAFNNLQV